MPTGYTAGVEDGTITTLEQFAMTCARAFGALITMRDAPFGKPIPERFEPDTSYYVEQLSDAEARVEALTVMTPQEQAAAANADFIERYMSYEMSKAEQNLRNERHNAMLALVKAWEVPDDLKGLKEFMVDQLEISIYNYDEKPPVEQSWQAWHSEELLDAVRDVERYQKIIREEIDRTEGRNKWLSTLREALEPKKPAKRKIQV